MRYSLPRSKRASVMAHVLLILFAAAFRASPVASLGIRVSSLPERRIGSIAFDHSPKVSPSASTTTRINSATEIVDGSSSNSSNSSRRRIFRDLLMVATTGTMLPLSSSMARAETETAITITATTKSNYNYELGIGECQTTCARKCELSSTKASMKKNRLNSSENSIINNSSDCIDACVRSGQRYCHQTTSSKTSPSVKEATARTKYVATTKEPNIVSSKPIQGLRYNSNRGGAWRDEPTESTTSRYMDTTRESKIVCSKPIPGLRYNSNRGGAWRD